MTDKAQKDLYWQCLPGECADEFPTGFVTFGPAFINPALPLEALMLLPSTEGSRGLLRRVANAQDFPAGAGLGLFLSDPFLKTSQVCSIMQRRGISWLANLPAIALHDEDFLAEILDVGFSVENEILKLSEYRREGYKTMAVISAPAHAASILSAPADLVLVVPNTRELQVSFPSRHLRDAVVQEVSSALRDSGLDTPVVPLITATEAKTTSHMAVVRPELLGMSV